MKYAGDEESGLKKSNKIVTIWIRTRSKDFTVFKSNKSFNRDDHFLMAICKMGSKFVTLGSKVIFWAATFLFFWAAKLLFWQQKWAAGIIFFCGKNYFFEQQEFIFWAANILVIEIRNFGLFREKIFVKMHDI
jgi:hypothetical protein